MARTVTLKGNPLELEGEAISVGSQAPDVELSKDLKDTCKISDFKGKKVILAIVPSLDTPVCDVEATRFNKEATTLGDDVQVVVASMDLPPAQARWCGAQDAKNVLTVSDYKLRTLKAFGTFIPGLGIHCRAVFVLDPEGKVTYAEYVPEIAEQPDFEAALAAAKG